MISSMGFLFKAILHGDVYFGQRLEHVCTETGETLKTLHYMRISFANKFLLLTYLMILHRNK